jgi:hypothetical protein
MEVIMGNHGCWMDSIRKALERIRADWKCG